jgi:hypothetical protein
MPVAEEKVPPSGGIVKTCFTRNCYLAVYKVCTPTISVAQANITIKQNRLQLSKTLAF